MYFKTLYVIMYSRTCNEPMTIDLRALVEKMLLDNFCVDFLFFLELYRLGYHVVTWSPRTLVLSDT